MNTSSVREIIKRERRRRAFGLDSMCDWDFAHDNGENPQGTRYARNFTDHFDNFKKRGAGLLFFGSSGAGKSFAAAEIVNELTDKGYNCLFTSFLTIISDLRTLNFDAQRSYLNQIFEKDLVVFDDLGSEGDTNRNNELIMQIVNNCRRRNIPMIFTTPFTVETLKKSSSGPRLLALSRICQLCSPVTLYEPGSRRRQSRSEKAETDALLKGEEISLYGDEDDTAEH